MTRYAKLIEGILEFAPKNKDSIINYNLDVDMMIADGYKLFVQAEIPVTNKRYHIEYVETIDTITETVVYDETQAEADAREAEQREANFKREFFNTSLGWIRRTVTMANGNQKDFLSDLFPAIMAATKAGQTVNIIAYSEPDYTHDITDWTQYQSIVQPTAQFIQECLIQLGNDFTGAIN